MTAWRSHSWERVEPELTPCHPDLHVWKHPVTRTVLAEMSIEPSLEPGSHGLRMESEHEAEHTPAVSGPRFPPLSRGVRQLCWLFGP